MDAANKPIAIGPQRHSNHDSSDGRINPGTVHTDGQSWMKLTPDAKGSYINGTWGTLASEPVARLYFASQI